MYHSAWKVEFQLFNRSYSRLTFFSFIEEYPFHHSYDVLKDGKTRNTKPPCSRTAYTLAERSAKSNELKIHKTAATSSSKQSGRASGTNRTKAKT